MHLRLLHRHGLDGLAQPVAAPPATMVCPFARSAPGWGHGFLAGLCGPPLGGQASVAASHPADPACAASPA
eukprot:16443830-Heterocapsa_arctica.AAC.1